MFTGIIEELGKSAGLDVLADSTTLTVSAPLVAAGAAGGSSIAVNGVCLTVTRSGDGQFTADVMGETLARSTIGTLAPGDLVNLERPVLAGGRLDGHIVQGHVDGTGEIAQVRPEAGWRVLRIAVPGRLSRYLAEKGSVAVDGVSLTVSAVSEPASGGSPAGEWFEICLIPETLARTTLGGVSAGDHVNLEVDIIAKYTERLLAAGEPR
ncbi:MAG: riboflavin synthase [Streptosporangiaceae bacterium]